MDFPPQQAKALDAVAEWFKTDLHVPTDEENPDAIIPRVFDPTTQVFRLFGYAGTGKTTLAKHLVSQLDCKSVFAAYTGKATSVLRRKGCNASTIHSLIYQPEDQDEELLKSLKKRMVEAKEAGSSLFNVLKKDFIAANRPKFILRPNEALDDIDLIVIDEVSMVNEEMGNDLLSFGKKILVLGDPAQLPPIEGGGFFTAHKPDILLTEIHRQARDNPIITMASLVRQGHWLKAGMYGSSKCVPRKQLADDPRGFEQLLVGRNVTRKGWNSAYRSLLGLSSPTPEQGEKVICLKNNKSLGILNGTQWRVRNAEDLGYAVRMEVSPWEQAAELGEEDGITLEAHQFETDYSELQWYERNKAEEFDFGYAMTVHKSQGSQWKNGLIMNESYVFQAREGKPDYSKNWLYTALTRFEEQVVVAL